MTARSARREVRNPVLALPSAQRLNDLPPEARAALRALLDDLATQAAEKALISLAKSKPPMFAYWSAVKVYAKHFKHAVRP